MVQHPFSLVEFGRGSGPLPVVSLEPGGPLARVFAGQQPGQPGGPDVGVFVALGQGSALGGRIACYGLVPSTTVAHDRPEGRAVLKIAMSSYGVLAFLLSEQS